MSAAGIGSVCIYVSDVSKCDLKNRWFYSSYKNIDSLCPRKDFTWMDSKWLKNLPINGHYICTLEYRHIL